MGYAYQKGLLPLSAAAIEQAIEVNGVSIKMNKEAFRLGRLAVVDIARLEAMMKGQDAAVAPKTLDAMTLDEIIAYRSRLLADYQDEAYAEKYRKLVGQVRDAALNGGYGEALPRAVAINYAKLLAYKDEYEVARLYADPAFLKQVYGTFDGDRLRLRFHLAPPLLALRNKSTGLPRKMTFGPWMVGVFKLLARLKFLRGSLFDPFGHTRERRAERRLISDYEAMLETLMAKLTAENHHIAVGLASVPEKIRGYGHVKMRHLEAAKSEEAALLEQFGASPSPVLKAAE
jgi:indolepyruvate ferredoxin oxidoreductase